MKKMRCRLKTIILLLILFSLPLSNFWDFYNDATYQKDEDVDQYLDVEIPKTTTS